MNGLNYGAQGFLGRGMLLSSRLSAASLLAVLAHKGTSFAVVEGLYLASLRV